ncbi:MAG TPA: hypothetical protein VFR09_08950 [Alphaproteobacteria bacterium]|nr:hypothetical protein [Alphaproteobacteria bacterium]
MTISRANYWLLPLLIAVSPALAQTTAAPVSRDASFAPVGSAAPVTIAPAAVPIASTAPIATTTPAAVVVAPVAAPAVVAAPITAAPVAVAPVAAPAIALPQLTTPVASVAPVVTTPAAVVTAPAVVAPAVVAPAVAVAPAASTSAPINIMPPATAPIASTVAAPVGSAVTAPATAAPVVVAPVGSGVAAPVGSAAPVIATIPAPVPVPTNTKPVEIAKPVETAPIGTIDPQSIGLSGPNEGGLGATMWKGMPRAFVDKLLPGLSLPTSSATLNSLARRMMLTTAAVPEGQGGNQSLTSMRIEKLVALGDAADAWKLASLAKPDQVDEIAWHAVAEAGLISPVREDVCAKLPDIVKAHTSAEWQKLTLICQLRAKDTKAAQLTIDLLHTQNVKDDVFFYIAEKDVMATGKQLPRQLTPMKPLTLALLRMTDLQLPGEVYTHADAPLIPELLQSRSHEEGARVGLAERSASRGLISASDLAAVYASVTFTPDALAAANSSPETGPRLHALLYQAALQEKSLQNRVNSVSKFIQFSDAALVNGPGAQVMVQMLGDIQSSDDTTHISGTIAHVYVLAGKGDKALEWLRAAKKNAVGLPPITVELQSFWPQAVLAGMESESDFTIDLGTWLDAYLKQGDPRSDGHAQRDQAANILLLLDAAGFTIPDEQWAKVMDTASFDRRVLPQPLLFERLRMAGTANRRGEAVLLATSLGSGNDVSILSTIESVRALKQVGLTADAALLAREAAANIMQPPQKM